MNFKGTLIDWMCWRKNQWVCKYVSRNLLNWKSKRKKNGENKTEYQKLWKKYKRGNISARGIPEEDREKGTEDIFEVILVLNIQDYSRQGMNREVWCADRFLHASKLFRTIYESQAGKIYWE